MSENKFQGTILRWKRQTRYYELAALLVVMLLAVFSAFLTLRAKDALRDLIEAAERRQDAREAAEAEPLMREAERRRRAKLREEVAKAEKVRIRMEENQRILKEDVPLMRRLEQEGKLTEPSFPFIVYYVLRYGTGDLAARPGEYSALASYARTGDPALCALAQRELNKLAEMGPRDNGHNAKHLQDALREMNRPQSLPQQVAGAAKQVMVERRSMNIVWARGFLRRARRGMFIAAFEAVRRYRMWLNHEVWWLDWRWGLPPKSVRLLLVVLPARLAPVVLGGVRHSVSQVWFRAEARTEQVFALGYEVDIVANLNGPPVPAGKSLAALV
jgi:hypothetical protein